MPSASKEWRFVSPELPAACETPLAPTQAVVQDWSRLENSSNLAAGIVTTVEKRGRESLLQFARGSVDWICSAVGDNSAPNGHDGCGKEVTEWLKRVAPRPQPPVVAAPAKPSRPKPQLTLDQLPAECKVVLESGPKPAPASAVAAQR